MKKVKELIDDLSGAVVVILTIIPIIIIGVVVGIYRILKGEK